MIKQLTSRIQSRNLAKGARVALAAGQRNTERATNGTRRRNQWNTELANKGRKTQPNGARARNQRNRELASKGTGNPQSTELSDFPDAPITLMTRPETIDWKIPVN